ncbi:MAG TPA: glycosyltransferase [Phycisphaerales bacterium]|nr:glycosyltransferase [Phycisphaerales bacterium]
MTSSSGISLGALRSWAGRHAREAAVHARRLVQPRTDDRVMIFPSRGIYSGSANLRGYVLAEELRELGWRALVVPAHLTWPQRLRLIRAERPRVIYLQSCRHELNQPGMYKGIAPVVFDIDDADYHEPGLGPKYEAACRDSACVFAASRDIAAWCGRHAKRVEIVWTSHPERTRPTPPQAQRAPIVAWAQVSWENYPAEAEYVRKVILALAKKRRFRFDLYAVKTPAQAEAFLRPLRDAGVECLTHPYLDNERFVRSLETAAVGLHVLLGSDYAKGKSFGKVLSYLVAGDCIVARDPFETSRFLRHGETALLGETPEDLAAHCGALLDDPAARERLEASAYGAFRAQLATPVVAKRVDGLLRSIIGGNG